MSDVPDASQKDKPSCHVSPYDVPYIDDLAFPDEGDEPHAKRSKSFASSSMKQNHKYKDFWSSSWNPTKNTGVSNLQVALFTSAVMKLWWTFVRAGCRLL